MTYGLLVPSGGNKLLQAPIDLACTTRATAFSTDVAIAMWTWAPAQMLADLQSHIFDRHMRGSVLAAFSMRTFLAAPSRH